MARKPPVDPPNPLNRLPPARQSTLLYFIVALTLLWIWQEALHKVAVRTIPYSEFKTRLAEGQVKEADIKPDEIVGKVVVNPKLVRPPADGHPAANDDNAFVFSTTRVDDPALVNELESQHVQYTGVRPSVLSQFLWMWALPLLLFIGLGGLFGKRLGMGASSILNIGKSKARLMADRETGVTFKDVAGCDEAKFELQEVVDFLKHPDHYQALGAKIPKGVLLVGPPGTGKTLLARAVAGEAHVPFFSLSGSEFVEMFVGVGAARVRDLFVQAKAQAPCIVFIDELDAIGRQRGVHLGPVNDEREQTLNQLLVEMDGFEPNAGIILLAATNRPEILDRAMLRPGRFDRQVVVDLPDIDGREQILQIYARNKPFEPSVELRKVAESTAGFSGADLANIVNEAALLAARRKASRISQKDFEEAVEKVMAGPERKSRRLEEKDKRRVAFHESGHALVAAFSDHADPVRKISLVPRGRAALGFTMQVPTQEKYLLSQAQLFDQIKGLLGGRAAEELMLGDVSTGAENDLEKASILARQMIAIFGMGKEAGLVHWGQRQDPNYLPGFGQPMHQDVSEETARIIDREVKGVMEDAYQKAKTILEEKRAKLEKVAQELFRKETLDEETFRRLVGVRPAEPLVPIADASAQDQNKYW